MKREITTKELTIMAVAFIVLAIAAIVSFFIPPVGEISTVVCILLLPFLYFGIKCNIAIFKEIFKK